ncbi:SDR family NAD(P)-dependent oxidoreductase [Litorivicinus sp.]|nr:SDR family NAD(P)-dependent oxidoreductase [Litorivicinus sp.]
MLPKSSEIVFDQRHLDQFSEISGDRNPLHMSETYARTSQFGQQVMFGVGAFLYCWKKISFFLPETEYLEIHTVFSKPIFLNQKYSIRYTRSESTLLMEILDGTTILCSSCFSWGIDRDKKHDLNTDSLYALTGESEDLFRSYSCDMSDLLVEPASNILTDIIHSLCFISRDIGMRVPGQDALFLGFSLTLNGKEYSPLSLANYQNIKYSLYKTILKTDGLILEAESVKRPSKIAHRLELVSSKSMYMPNKTVFVAGAGRGLGWAIAATFLKWGHRVIACYASIDENLLELAREFGNESLILFKCDLAAPGSAQDIIARFGRSKIDIFILCAAPKIDRFPFKDLARPAYWEFIDVSMAIYRSCLLAWTRIRVDQGVFLLISSEWVKEMNPQFTHYIAAKIFQEEHCKLLAQEDVEGVYRVYRPPRMLTDQTNSTFKMGGSSLASIYDVSADICTKIAYDSRSNDNAVDPNKFLVWP